MLSAPLTPTLSPNNLEREKCVASGEREKTSQPLPLPAMRVNKISGDLRGEGRGEGGLLLGGMRTR